jgi:hypothetical protein
MYDPVALTRNPSSETLRIYPGDTQKQKPFRGSQVGAGMLVHAGLGESGGFQ